MGKYFFIMSALSGCGEVWYRAWFGTKRTWVRIPLLRPFCTKSSLFIVNFLCIICNFLIKNTCIIPPIPMCTPSWGTTGVQQNQFSGQEKNYKFFIYNHYFSFSSIFLDKNQHLSDMERCFVMLIARIKNSCQFNPFCFSLLRRLNP